MGGADVDDLAERAGLHALRLVQPVLPEQL